MYQRVDRSGETITDDSPLQDGRRMPTNWSICPGCLPIRVAYDQRFSAINQTWITIIPCQYCLLQTMNHQHYQAFDEFFSAGGTNYYHRQIQTDKSPSVYLYISGDLSQI